MGLISRVSSRTYREPKMAAGMDQRTMQLLQQIQQDPAPAQQLQAEMQKMQVQAALKAQVSAIHKKCFPKCFTAEVTIDRASSGQEKCLANCGKELIQVSMLVKKEIEDMVQRSSQSRSSYY